uniref:Lebercilin domain-containing protein n=1 Tax=Plectus sambesii TaxID=2011161 RepID=A0A914VNG9_9BILA
MSDDDFWGHPIKRTTTTEAVTIDGVADGRPKEATETSASIEQQHPSSAAASTNISVGHRSHASSSADDDDDDSSSSDPFYSEDSAESESMWVNEAAQSDSHSTSSDEQTQEELRFTPYTSPTGPYPLIVNTRRQTPSLAKRTVDRYVVKDAATKKAVRKVTNDNSKPSRRQRPQLSVDVGAASKSATTVTTLLSTARPARVTRSARSSSLADQVHYLEHKLREALTVNRTLESIQKRQDAALARREKQRLTLGNDGPPLADRHLEEVRVLREKVRLQRQKLNDQERLLYKRNAEMLRVNNKAKQLETALKERDASSDKALRKSLPPTAAVRADLEEKNKRVQKLQRQVELLEKNHRHALGIETARHKETQRRLIELEEELSRVRKQRSSLFHKRPSANEPQSTAMVTDAGAEARRTQRRSESQSKGKPAKKETINSRAIQPTDLSPSEPAVSPKPATVKSKALVTNPRKKARSRSVSKRSASVTDEAQSVQDDSSSSDAPTPHPVVVKASELNAKLHLDLTKSQKAVSSSSLALPKPATGSDNAIVDSMTYRRDSVNRERTFALPKDYAPLKVSQSASMTSKRMNVTEGRHNSLPQQSITTVSSKMLESDPFAGLKPTRVTRNATQNSSKSQPTQTGRRNSLFDELFGPKRQTQSAELRLKILSDFKDEDLFPELKQKKGASNATATRGSAGLFPWEIHSDAAGVPASVKSYDIAQFS